MTTTREMIEQALRNLNEAENSSTLIAAEKAAAIDLVHASDAREWVNGKEHGDRTAEREMDASLYSTFPDYRRQFRHVVIDPPHAAMRWRMTGTNRESGVPLDLSCASFAHFDEDGRITESWVYFDAPPAKASTGAGGA